MAVWQGIQAADGAVAGTRSAWAWLGQAALTVLGTHLACDRLDDHVLWLLHHLPLQWQSPGAAAVPATWVAIVLELTVAAWVVTRLWATLWRPPTTWAHLRETLSIRSVVLTAFWVPISLAGAWVIAMAVEDGVAPWLGAGAVGTWSGALLGWLAGGLALWRLGWTGLLAVLSAPRPRSRWAGVWIAPALLGLAALALSELPIWQWTLWLP